MKTTGTHVNIAFNYGFEVAKAKNTCSRIFSWKKTCTRTTWDTRVVRSENLARAPAFGWRRYKCYKLLFMATVLIS